MISFKATYKPSARRDDGTWPLRIRVYCNGDSRWLPTNIVLHPEDLTRSGKIKNATVLEKAEDLIRGMRATVEGLSPFTLESWTVDECVAHIRRSLAAERWTLDIFAFAETFLKDKRPQTRKAYDSALNAFARFLGKRECDVNDITRRMLLSFVEWYELQPSQHRNPDGSYGATSRPKVAHGASSMYVAKLAHIYNAAKFKHNDEDAGIIRIPRSPFDGLRKSYPASHGQRALTVPEIQALIDAEPAGEIEILARAAFLVSLVLGGVNLADLWSQRGAPSGEWRYFRQKTRNKRADRAEVRVTIPGQLSPFLGRLCAKQGPSPWWLSALHRWGSVNSATQGVNEGLRSLAARLSLEPFTFYAARHSFGTLARAAGVEKATVADAMAHVGDYRVTDIYAQRNWSLVAEAQRTVVALFRWPEN